MKKLMCFMLPFLSVATAFAATGSDVELRASTVSGAALGGVGQFDTTQPDRLIFRVPDKPDLVVPYAQISEFSSQQEVAHHVGVLAAIVIGLLKARQQRHLLSISYTDAKGAIQVATFEVAKRLPEELLPVLHARARNACERAEFGGCIPVVSQPRRPLSP